MTIDGVYQFPPQDPNEYNGGSVIPCAVITAVLSTILVALRLYARGVLLRVLGWEDVFIIFALVFSWGTSVAMSLQLRYGLGRHLQFVLIEYLDYAKVGLFTGLLYTLSLTFTKISILCLYIRILTYDTLRLVGKIMLGIVIVSHTWIIASILTSCVPINSIWDWTVRAQYCHSYKVFWANGGLNMTTDFLIFLLPMTVLHKLKIGRKQKWALYAVFLLAFGVCIVSLIRMIWLLQMQDQAMTATYLDLTWIAVKIANWTMIEVNFGIICACLTTLRPILNRIFPQFTGYRPHSPNDNANPQPVIDEYDRPLTIGNIPTRPVPAARRASASSILVGDDDKVDEPDSKVTTPVSEKPENRHIDLEAQLPPPALHHIAEPNGIPMVQPGQAHLHESESHDSLFRCSSRAVSQHKVV